MQAKATVPVASLACSSQGTVPQTPDFQLAAAHAQPLTIFPIAFQPTPLSACAAGACKNLVVTWRRCCNLHFAVLRWRRGGQEPGEHLLAIYDVMMSKPLWQQHNGSNFAFFQARVRHACT